MLRETYDNLLLELAGNHERITAESLVMWFSSQNLYLTSDFGEFQRDANMSSGPDIYAPTFLPHKVIKINDIQYFTKEGDVQYTTKISGGGGGGSSIGGAIVGGAIAGDAGAIIGSRKKVESIKSTTVTHDDRKTVLRYYDKGAIKTLTWAGYDVYNFFLQYIPEKDLLTIQINSQPKPTAESPQPAATKAKPVDMSAKLEELSKLYKAGLIDDTEYKKAKAKILGL